MTDPVFTAKIRPVLTQRAANLVGVYESTFGASGPGCCPEAAAALIEAVADEIVPEANLPVNDGAVGELERFVWRRGQCIREHLTALAAELRGEAQ